MFDEEMFRSMAGWFGVEEAKVLYEKVVETQGLVVELGSWAGRSTYALACAVRDSNKPPMIAVDRFTGSHEHRRNGRPVWTFPLYWRNMSNAKMVPDHIISVIGDTVQTARLFANESVGFLFHDASHEFDNVCADLNAWLPKLRKDGVLCTHDLDVGTVQECGRRAGFNIVVEEATARILAEHKQYGTNCFIFSR